MKAPQKQLPSFPISEGGYEGMSKLEYFAAHAPTEIPAWFNPEMIDRQEGEKLDYWKRKYEIERLSQWPIFWANAVLDKL